MVAWSDESRFESCGWPGALLTWGRDGTRVHYGKKKSAMLQPVFSWVKPGSNPLCGCYFGVHLDGPAVLEPKWAPIHYEGGHSVMADWCSATDLFSCN